MNLSTKEMNDILARYGAQAKRIPLQASAGDVRTVTQRGVLAEMLYRLENPGVQWFRPITFKARSNQPDGETHAWLGGMPQMQKRTGELPKDKPRVNKFFIANQEWAAGVPIDIRDWEFQKNDVISKQVADGVGVVNSHPGLLIQDAIAAGEDNPCSDGQYFFDTDHSEGASGTQTNDLTHTKAGSTIAAVDVLEAILKGIAAIMSFKDDKGNYCNPDASSFHVGVPTALYPQMLKVMGGVLVEGGNTTILNKNNETFQLSGSVLPRTTGNKVYVFRKREPDMGSAFVHQLLVDPYPVVLGPDTEYAKIHDQVLFMFKGNYNVGFGRWQDACLITIS